MQDLPQVLPYDRDRATGDGSPDSPDREVGEDHRVAVDVRTGEDLAAAIAAGVHLARVTVFADALSQSELQATVNLGVGRVAAGSVQQIETLRSVVAQRAQDVVIRMTECNTPILPVAGGFRFDSNEADAAISAVLDHEWLNLVGLRCGVGAAEGVHDFVAVRAIGHIDARDGDHDDQRADR